MPVYEYESVHGCDICGGKFEHLQNIADGPLTHCPTCGLDVRRVISKAQIKVRANIDFDHAAKKGITTFRRSEKGVYERIAGDGADRIEDKQTKSEPKVKKVDFDK